MKVLLIAPLSEPITGHSLASQVLRDGLQRSHEVRVVNLTNPELRPGLISLRRTAAVLRILVKVRRAKRNADVIYLTISESVAGNIKDLLIYLVCFRELPRMVVHLHGGSIRTWIFDKHKFLLVINKFFLSRVGAVIVLGESHLTTFAGIVSDKKVHIIPNFAEDYLFSTEDQIEAKFADTRIIRILFLSNLVEGKGHEDLLEAYSELESDLQHRLSINFAGAFESRQDKSQFVQKVARLSNVTYHGVVRGGKKKELLNSAHVFCLPTRFLEGQPISLLEAYASGCVAVTTNNGGICDVFRDSVNGYVVLPGDSNSLRRVLARIVETAEELLPFALKNYQTAKAVYRTSKYLHSVEALLMGVGDNHAGLRDELESTFGE